MRLLLEELSPLALPSQAFYTNLRTGPNKMRPLAFVLLSAILLIGCERGNSGGDRTAEARDRKAEDRQYKQVTINLERRSSNVDISSYVLITDDIESDRGDAEAIMRLRAKLPLAVQTKDASLFDRVLASGYTFRAADEFWNREPYIRTRVDSSESVGTAHYENLVLQFFGDVAVSTYRNAVQVTDASGQGETLHMTWASVYVKEDGEWKIGANHLIDKRSVR